LIIIQEGIMASTTFRSKDKTNRRAVLESHVPWSKGPAIVTAFERIPGPAVIRRQFDTVAEAKAWAVTWVEEKA